MYAKQYVIDTNLKYLKHPEFTASMYKQQNGRWQVYIGLYSNESANRLRDEVRKIIDESPDAYVLGTQEISHFNKHKTR